MKGTPSHSQKSVSTIDWANQMDGLPLHATFARLCPEIFPESNSVLTLQKRFG